jgi:small multidrug resistance pump
MEWLYLMLAILIENAGTTSAKLSHGLTRLLPAIFMFGCYALAYTCFALALKKLEVSVAYAIWSGLGTTLITLIGILWFRETVTPTKLFAIGVIIAGVVILNLSSTAR